MSTSGDKSGKSSAKLIYKLACKLTGKDGDDVTTDFKFALQYAQRISSSPQNELSEKEIMEDIKISLVKDKRDKDAVRLAQLYLKLLSNTILKNRWAIYKFLYCLKDSNVPKTNAKSVVTTKHASFAHFNKMPALESEKEHNYEAIRSFWQGSASSQSRLNNNSNKTTSEHKNIAMSSVPENVILREMLYAFQAIDGQYLKFDSVKEELWIDPKVSLSVPVKQQALKMAELGWLYNRVHKYYINTCNRRSGRVEQSFAAALQNELTEYYRILAVLDSQLQQEDEQGINSNSGGLTMSSLKYWTLDPVFRFKILASLIDTCKGLKGGALASAIYSYLIHGDPVIRNLVKTIWTSVSVPIYRILKRWIIDGELDDVFEEFFVAVVPGVSKDHLWDEQYRLRESMVPSFITVDQAYKILSTGKAINFLRHVCLDKTSYQQRSTVSKIMDGTCAESVFTSDQDGDLQKIIDVTYKETSRHLLNIMHTTYKFMDHLKAMRRYLLLGQGDFIRHLMDLLEPHLNQSANTLYMQNLSGILDTAIRSTNAQYDDLEILKRLDNRLMEVSSGDCGWDIYTLDYKIDGPIGTVFTPKVMKMYLQLFHYLWKAKRMEYSLSEMWCTQMAFSRSFKPISEFGPIMHHCHILTSEMIHFIQQMQYYITFEVMECSWDVLETKVKAAGDLDKVINAHEEFLDTIITRALLDDSSQDLRMQLQTIYNVIIQFKGLQEQLFELAKKELDLRLLRTEEIKKDSESELYDKKVEDEKLRRADFVLKVVYPMKSQLRILSTTYQDMVKKFLLKLTIHRDANLRFLSFRLDFNSHYKKQDDRLHRSMTFQKRRQVSSTHLIRN